MKTPVTFQDPPSAIPIDPFTLMSFGVNKEDIRRGEKRFEIKSFGPWDITHTIRGLAISKVWPEFGRPTSATVYGMRTMTNCRQNGYSTEGQVSIKGKKHRAFTSNQLFELPGGHLVNVAEIVVCLKENKKP